VKEIQPHEERFFKDIVLKSILEEISNEQGKTLQDLIPYNPPKYSTKQITWLSFISVSIITISAILIPLTIMVTEPVQIPALTTLQTDTQEQQVATNLQKQPSGLLIQSEENSHIIVSKNSAKTSIEPTQQSAHERAKAELLQQMKN